ncbi:HpcH/HpaI aldolase/citrate lyase family protein [Granulicoccus phenolivorans]|uniref:HpcH/HpaI aldolase/citrate lyase family protein n=1 Tax=Granulicoccus phenolivorans TaxID=266854 RepID=UPI00047B9BF0|nr:CoA ester lyase [Granulicoccus phenolivorans]
MSGWVPAGPAFLFCPADRPDRYAKAADRCDVVILDLEDAVAPGAKAAAREAVLAQPLDPARTIVRINALSTEYAEADLAALAQTDYRVVMLAKAETAADVARVADAGFGVLALLETPLGILNAAEVAAAPGTVGLMWGAEDLVAGLGGATSRFTDAEAGQPVGKYRDVPRYARSAAVLAAAAYGRFMIDSVHLDIADTAGLRAEALDAVNLGLAGTACIHPSQVAVVREAYAPSDEQVAWAKKVLAAAEGNAGVFQLDGQMVDAPVFRQAEAILRRVR